MEPFSDEEKRFIMAEMVKNSQLDVKTLGRFVKSNRIEPNWMQMQLPAGRNMAQCMQAADSLDLHQRGKKRKESYKELDSQSSKDVPSSSSQELPPLPRAASKHVPILPRPSVTPSEPPSLSQAQAVRLPPKKKGRPAYAGRAVSGPRPFCPRPIAPKPTAEPEPGRPRPLLRPIAPAPRPILPRITHPVLDQEPPPLPSRFPSPVQQQVQQPAQQLAQQPFLQPVQQLAQQPTARPVARSQYTSTSGFNPSALRRKKRRQRLGIKNGLSGPLLKRAADCSPLRSESPDGIKREPLEDTSPGLLPHLEDESRTATKTSTSPKT
ncbi:hypothetical protein NM208_g11677 [Fusarium decemcellulare]|uniref:Uncharacterized protein n=1 Tax=Fusarium decemcellulare TaxID=57161 RepID=A0ACC1RTG8_9HYPO|nr:hypothetical protein NM208_g11677 [Fusarium decemcellulare]